MRTDKRIDKIKNPVLKSLVKQGKHSSGTIEYDLHDALDGSETDEELITMWQSALEGLKEEVEHYWGSLEALKGRVEVAVCPK